MALLGNLIWFIFGGWVLGLTYLLGSIILFPLLPFLLPMVSYAFWPFGRKPVKKQAIAAYKEANGIELDEDKFANASGVVKFLGNFIWAITFGWVLALMHIISGVFNLVLCVTFIFAPVALPNALANFKLIPVAFTPFATRLVPIALANDIEKEFQKGRL